MGSKLLLHQSRSLSEFSTFGIGGPILYCALPKTIDEMREGLLFAKREGLPWMVVGKGSNCLFDDRGFEGVVLVNRIEGIAIEGTAVRAGGGASFSLLGVQTARQELTGLEFASGIPATVGGAVFMNAGAAGQETATTLVAVDYLTEEGEERRFQRGELVFSYRTSPFQKMRGVIVGATFQLAHDPRARGRQIALIEARIKSQPLKEKSAGCIFRNPEGCLSAGALIERCGLKGTSVGGAWVSEMHANFIVNRGGATAEEVEVLVQKIQKRVWEETGVHLEPEVRLMRNL